ncbi:MAG: hypothetical protein RRY29_01455 [Desulfovibrionaceae bacterium]
MTTPSPQNMLEYLEQACQQVQHFESNAQQALTAGNVDEYRALMLQKAQFLAHLDSKSQKYCEELPKALRAKLNAGLRRFSASATNALAVNSVFYMSALLYPEDYVQGTPNDLVLFTNALRQSWL